MSDAIRPGAAWYLVAAGILVGSIFAIAVLGLNVLDEVVEMFNPQVLPGIGEFDVAIEEAGPYTIYLEVDRRSGDPDDSLPEAEELTPGVRLEVVDDAGQPLALEEPTGAMVARRNAGFLPRARFEAMRTGHVTVRVAWPEGAPDPTIQHAVGRSVSAGGVRSVTTRFGVIWAVLLLGGGAAFAIFLITLVRRREAVRRLEADAVARLIGDRQPE